MTYYWRARNIPELRDLKPKDRGRWWREARVSSSTVRDGWVLVIVVVAGCFATDMLIGHLHPDALIRHVVVLPLMCALGMTVEWVYDAWSQQPRARAWLRVNLAGRLAGEQVSRERRLYRFDGLEAFDARRRGQDQGRL